MAQPMPDTWADEVLRKGDLEAFERRMSRRFARFEDRINSFGDRSSRLGKRLEGFEDRFGRRLFWTWLLTNSLTVLGCFLLVLLARSV